MGVKERQEREREAVSRAILDAARELFVAEGYDNVSLRKIAERIEYSPAAIYGYFPSKDDILFLRKIAERIEYSPAAIYGYFPSKDDIFFALAEEGFRTLLGSAASCGTAVDEVTDPVDHIRRALLGVFEFSKSHPEYYRLMFLDRSVPRISKDWTRFGFVRDMRLQLDALIQSAIETGRFPAGSRPDVLFRIMLTAVHGAAVMRLCDRLSPGEDADALARDALEAVLTGLRAGSPVTSRSAGCHDPGNPQ